MAKLHLIKSFDSKFHPASQLFNCVGDYNADLVLGMAELIKNKHLLIESVFEKETNNPLFFISAVQEIDGNYDMVLQFSPAGLVLDESSLGEAVINCLGRINKATSGICKQLFIEANIFGNQLAPGLGLGGLKFMADFSELHLHLPVFEANFNEYVKVQFLRISEFSRQQMNDLFLLSSKDSLDCPEALEFRSVSKVCDALFNYTLLDPAASSVAVLNGIIAGFTLISKQDKHAEISYVGVLPNFRNQCIGKWLVRKSLGQLKLNGVNTVGVLVDDKNIPALALYSRLGMVFKKSWKLFLSKA